MTPFLTSQLFKHNYTIPDGCDLTVNRGGTSSGKTYSIMQVIFLIAWKRPKSIITVVGQDIPNLKKGAIRDAATIYGDSEFIQSIIKGYNNSDRIYTLHNGSIIEFNSYGDEQDAKNGKRDYAFFNEVNGVPYAIFEQIYIRTRIHTWCDFNPSSEFWLDEKEIEKRSNVRTIKSNFIHNPFLDVNTISKIKAYEPTPENIENKTANEYRWKVYGLGEYATREGAIYSNWERGKFNNDLPVIYGMDFGATDPFTIIKCAFDMLNKKVWVQVLVYETNLNTEQLKQRATDHLPKDSLCIIDSADKTKRLDFQNWGFNVYPSYKEDKITRIQDIQSFRIVVCDSPDLEKELNNKVWMDKRSNYPCDGHDHALDPLEYCHTYLKRNG